jgi:hypothetical protein
MDPGTALRGRQKVGSLGKAAEAVVDETLGNLPAYRQQDRVSFTGHVNGCKARRDHRPWETVRNHSLLAQLTSAPTHTPGGTREFMSVRRPPSIDVGARPLQIRDLVTVPAVQRVS